MSLRKISVNYLCVPFSEHFEQPMTIAQRVNGVLFISRCDGILKPGGDAWIRKDLFESHTQIMKAGNATISSCVDWRFSDA
jgi:hypothetical protein